MRPVNTSSAARCAPTTLLNNHAPPSPGIIAKFTKVEPKRAWSDAIRKSHNIAKSKPAPTAAPFTAAMSGFSKLYMSLDKR